MSRNAALTRIYNDLKEQEKHLLFLTLGGSHAYGTNHENSDTDYRGVYMSPTVQFLGLNPPVNPKPFERSEPDDVVIHEVGKFMDLALKNNPNILEILFVEPEEWIYVRESF